VLRRGAFLFLATEDIEINQKAKSKNQKYKSKFKKILDA
jgi:hypothetical protein